MNISEAIERLEKLKSIHGNIPVMIDIEPMNFGNPQYEPIAFGFRPDDNILEVW